MQRTGEMRPHEKRNQNGFDSIFLKKEREEEGGAILGGLCRNLNLIILYIFTVILYNAALSWK